MSRIRLDNTAWGFASSCFVCEDANDGGLRIPFFHDDEADCVVAEFTLDERFSGSPSYLHGGISMAVLDEAMAWATIAIAGKFALTRRASVEFARPVRVGKEYRVEARLDGPGDTERDLATSASIFDHRDRVCVRASASFAVIDLDQAEAAVGTTLNEDDAGFTR